MHFLVSEPLLYGRRAQLMALVQASHHAQSVYVSWTTRRDGGP